MSDKDEEARVAASAGTPPPYLSAQVAIHVCAALVDGEWHSWDDVVDAVTPKVPPSVAARVGVSEWRRSYRRRGTKPRPRAHYSEALVRFGARTVIARAVRNFRNYFEKSGTRGSLQIRMISVPPRLRDYVPPMRQDADESEPPVQ